MKKSICRTKEPRRQIDPGNKGTCQIQSKGTKRQKDTEDKRNHRTKVSGDERKQ